MNKQKVLPKRRAPADLPGGANRTGVVRNGHLQKGKTCFKKIKAEVNLNQSSLVQGACMFVLL